MLSQNEENSIDIIYKFNRKGTRLFGSEFVENNKDKCKIIYKDKEYELTDYFNFVNNYNDDELISIKLNGIDNIINASYMFYYCESLISLPDISKWNTSNIRYINGLFSYCNSLLSLPDISKWNVDKINNFDCMFEECLSLKSLPDISNWDTSNASSMNYMFKNCKSLISLPDISKWNYTNKYKKFRINSKIDITITKIFRN